MEVEVPGLEDSDVDRLIESLDRDNKLGQLKGLSLDGQRKIMIRESGRQLLVAMIKATSGEDLQKKAVEELRALKQPRWDLYAITAIATALRHRLHRDELLAAAGHLNNEGAYALDLLAERRLISIQDGMYELRHRLIAELVVADLRTSGANFSGYKGLATVLAAKHKPGDRTSRTGRFLIALINHRRIDSFFGSARVREFYQSLEDFLTDDYHFWLQRGGYELDYGKLQLARNYLQQAHNLGGGDYRVETEWAHYLMKQACADADADNAEDLVAEAKEILLRQIEARGTSDHYAYHVFGSQMIGWLRRARFTPAERTAELKRTLEIVERGSDLHPRDRSITELRDQLKQEYLMTAVTAS